MSDKKLGMSKVKKHRGRPPFEERLRKSNISDDKKEFLLWDKATDKSYRFTNFIKLEDYENELGKPVYKFDDKEYMNFYQRIPMRASKCMSAAIPQYINWLSLKTNNDELRDCAAYNIKFKKIQLDSNIRDMKYFTPEQFEEICKYTKKTVDPVYVEAIVRCGYRGLSIKYDLLNLTINDLDIKNKKLKLHNGYQIDVDDDLIDSLINCYNLEGINLRGSNITKFPNPRSNLIFKISQFYDDDDDKSARQSVTRKIRNNIEKPLQDIFKSDITYSTLKYSGVFNGVKAIADKDGKDLISDVLTENSAKFSYYDKMISEYKGERERLTTFFLFRNAYRSLCVSLKNGYDYNKD